MLYGNCVHGLHEIKSLNMLYFTTIRTAEQIHTHNAVVIAVPEQHGAVVACGAVQVQNQRIHTVLLPADVGNVIPDHLFLCGWIHPLSLFSCGNKDGL